MTPHTNNGGVPGPIHPSPGPQWPSTWAGRGLMSVIGRSVHAFSEVASFMQSTGLGKGWPEDLSSTDATERRLDESNWPSRPLRIGLVRAGTWATRLMAAQGTWSTEWFHVPDGEARASACRDFVLDAVVRTHAGNGLQVEVCENPDKDAAWFDWSQCCPLSYPAVFPTRLDTAKLVLTDAISDEPATVRALLETAALFSRHPARLTREDRVKGRRPFLASADGSPSTDRFTQAAACIDAQLLAMETLAGVLSNARPSDSTRAISRVLGAFLATTPNWSSDAARIASMDDCARLSADEPQTMLRLAAVRLGMGQDDAGLDAIERADRMLRDNQLVSATSQEAFIRSELEHGHPGPLTIGRLAAGICLLVSTMPASRVPYFRDDLMDDMRFSSVLIGRDQDRKLLIQVFRALERVRRAESFGLPAGHATSSTLRNPTTNGDHPAPVPFNRSIFNRSVKPRTTAETKPAKQAKPRKRAA